MDPKKPIQKLAQPLPINPNVVASKVELARKNFEKAFKDFMPLLEDKLLDRNKSEAKKNVDAKIIQDLLKMATLLDHENMGEGIFALAAATLRTNLKLKDRINELEYQILKNVRDLKEFENKMSGGKKDEKPKG